MRRKKRGERVAERAGGGTQGDGRRDGESVGAGQGAVKAQQAVEALKADQVKIARANGQATVAGSREKQALKEQIREL